MTPPTMMFGLCLQRLRSSGPSKGAGPRQPSTTGAASLCTLRAHHTEETWRSTWPSGLPFSGCPCHLLPSSARRPSSTASPTSACRSSPPRPGAVRPPAACLTPVMHELETQQGAAGVVQCLDQLLSCCTPHGCPPACRVMRLGQGERLHDMTSCATGPRYGCSCGTECAVDIGRGVMAARCCLCADSRVRWPIEPLMRELSTCAGTLLRLNKCHSCMGVSWFLSPSPMLTSEK